MEIEVGGKYKTRGGWMAIVLFKPDEGGVTVDHYVPGTTYETRRHNLDGKCVTDSNYDLVAPWNAGDTRPAPWKGVEPKAATSNKGAPTVAISLGAGGWDVRCSGLTPEQVAAIVRHI